jgi:hypothetical protein
MRNVAFGVTRAAVLALVAVTAGVMSNGGGAQAAQPVSLSIAHNVLVHGGLYHSGQVLAAPMSDADTQFLVNDLDPFRIDMLVLIDSELMKVTSLEEGGLDPDIVGVVRGVESTPVVAHNAGRVVYRNVNFLEVQVSSVQHETKGTLASSLSSSEFESSGETLVAAINSTTQTLEVASTDPFFVDRTLLIGAEKMRVQQVLPGWMNNSGVTVLEDVDTEQQVIAISDHTLLQVGWSVLLGVPGSPGEELVTITELTPGSPPTMTVEERGIKSVAREHPNGTPIYGGPSYLTVTRGVDGTIATSHSAGAPIVHNVRTATLSEGFVPFSPGSHLQINNEKFYALKAPSSAGNVKLIRGLLGTTFSAHGAGSSVTDIDGFGSAGVTVGYPEAYMEYVLVEPGSHLLSTGRNGNCFAPNQQSTSVRVACTTEEPLPLGPIGPGNVIHVGFRTLATTGVTSQPVALSNPEATDVSGDAYAPSANGRNMIVVACADFTGNFLVGLGDFARITGRYQMNTSHPDWDPIYDLRPDGLITIADIAHAANQWSFRCYHP